MLAAPGHAGADGRARQGPDDAAGHRIAAGAPFTGIGAVIVVAAAAIAVPIVTAAGAVAVAVAALPGAGAVLGVVIRALAFIGAALVGVAVALHVIGVAPGLPGSRLVVVGPPLALILALLVLVLLQPPFVGRLILRIDRRGLGAVGRTSVTIGLIAAGVARVGALIAAGVARAVGFITLGQRRRAGSEAQGGDDGKLERRGLHRCAPLSGDPHRHRNANADPPWRFHPPPQLSRRRPGSRPRSGRPPAF